MKVSLCEKMALVLQKFTVGQVVYAKIKGYPPWPGVITHMPTEKKARVLYFNWNGEHNDLSIKKLTSFHAGRNIEQKYLNRNAQFTKAFHEMLLMVEAPIVEPQQNKKQIRIVLRQLTPADIKQIKSELKANTGKKQGKSRLRSGRLY